MFVFLVLNLSWLLTAQDCSQLTSPSICSAASHEGQKCYWKCEDPECIGANFGDLDHICGEKCSPTECASTTGCCWDEGKCQQTDDVENPQLCASNPVAETNTETTSASAGATTASSNTGATSRPLGQWQCELYDNNEAECTAQPHCWYKPGNPGEEGECDEIEDENYENGGIEGDCENYLTPADCTGKMHDGKTCMWSASSYECGESAFGDMEHVCDQYGNPTDCQGEQGCGWDSEGKCVQFSDLDTPEYNPNGSGQTWVPSPDCEDYFTTETCNGQTHEGKTCYFNNGECVESETVEAGGDPEHLCLTFTDETTCTQTAGCGWRDLGGNYGMCLSQDDYEADCEMYYEPQSCNGKMHDSKICYWDGQECSEGDIGDGQHVMWCASITDETSCTTQNYCSWSNEACGPSYGYPSQSSETGSGTSSNTGSGTSSNTGSGTMTGGDCEVYTDSDSCTGKFHDGKQCFWKYTNGDCEEGEASDPEKICGQYGPTDCPADQQCFFIEDKCQQPSSLLQQRQALKQPSSFQHYLWFGLFITASIGLGALCAFILRFVLCPKQNPNSSYVTLDDLQQDILFQPEP